MKSGCIVILEDDPARIRRFTEVLNAINPLLAVVCWRSAKTMIREIGQYLDYAQLISLDHDLYPWTGDIDDPGDGLEVAKYLSMKKPKCPVIIHSSNADRARMMAGEFELEGCAFKVVAPLAQTGLRVIGRELSKICCRLKKIGAKGFTYVRSEDLAARRC